MKLPSFIRIAKPAIPRLKASIPVVMALVACVALIWVWIYGPQWQWKTSQPFESLLSRWLITAVFVLIAVVWFSLKTIRRVQYLENLQVQAQTQVDDPVLADIDQQDHYLTAWQHQLQRHLNTSAYLYRLPWYMIIGARDSGKSTLLKESYDLAEISAFEQMHTEPEALRVRCWLGEQAVIIDPAGELIDQPASAVVGKTALNSRLWKHLLSWLATQRHRQLLNGIILTVDIYQLATADKNDRENYIAAMQQRLQELHTASHSHLPLYVVFTKLDLLYGFEAMYQTLDKNEREAVLGVTFSSNTGDGKTWLKELRTFWQQWIAQLNSAMPDMMLKTANGEQRSQLFSFIRQMQGLQDYVVQLLEGILYSGEHAQFLLRGVYLSSAQQRGQMDDLFTQSAAAQYHLTAQAFPTWPRIDTVPYFTKDLFNQTLFSEPNLAGENSVWRRKTRKRVFIVSTLAAMTVFALGGGWHYYYQINYQAGQDVLAQAKTFLSIAPPKGNDRYGNLQLPLLNPIRDATLAHGNYHNRNALLADMGLYQGANIGPYVESTYLQLLQQRFVPSLMSGLLVRLNAAPPGSEEKLEILRVMRMLEDGTGRNISLVKNYMSQRWSEQFTGQRELQQQLMGHLDYALKHTDWHAARERGDQHAITSFIPYLRPIQQAQQELSKRSIYQRVYQNLRIKAQDALPPPIELRDQIGASFNDLFISRHDPLLMIPYFLTRNGLQNYFVKQNDQLIDLTVMDSWVLNLTQNVEYSDADRKEIQRQVTEQYLGDYTNSWRAAMNNLSIKEFEDVQQAISAIEQVISGDQPFRRALQALSDNTRLPAISDTLPAKDRQALLQKNDYALLARINREFVLQTGVLQENEDKTSVIQSVYQKLTALHRYLLAIQNSPVPGKAALKAVQSRLQQHSSDPILEVQQQAKNLPEPLNHWVGELAEQAWRVVMIEALRSLEVEWHDTVVKPYQTYLAGRYPLSLNAKQDVPLSEFERFFGPNGTLDSFYLQNLKPLIDSNLNRGTYGQFLIRQDVLRQLAQAQKIRNTFFSAQNGLGTQFAVEPVTLSGNKRRSVLDLDGQLLDYAHGRSNTVHLIWPNSMRAGVESKITLVPNENGKSPRTLSFSGPWAQLRLINAGELTNVKSNAFDVRFKIDGGEMTYRIHVDESDNPFAGGLLSKFVLPETLY